MLSKEAVQELRNSSTNSVISYISSPEGQYLVKKYLNCVKRSKKLTPNYTDMLVTLDLDKSTTKDDVSFGSAFVDRGAITAYLGEVFAS